MFGQETKKIDQDLLSHYPLPKVDKRIELLGFDQYKDHPLIAFAGELSNKNGVSFDERVFGEGFCHQVPVEARYRWQDCQ